MESKPKSIELAEFREELLPSGRKLLHCIFKEKFGTFRYIWTPPWKGEYGVERLFFKALEIEEWNDYEGVWSKELRQAAQEIPSLEEIKLPVKIQVGGMVELAEDEDLPGIYSVAVDILRDEKPVWKEEKGKGLLICIGEVKISWDSLRSFLFQVAKGGKIWNVPESVETVSEWYGDEWNGERTRVYGDSEDVGIRFYVWLEAGLEKNEYQVIAKEIASDIRSFIRKRLSDYRALKRGFEEL